MVDSLIILFESTETKFTSNGIGNLPDATSCVVIEERNGKFELEMEYPLTGKRYSELKLRRLIYTKPNPFSEPQPFRIYSITRPINGIVTINAEHISYDLSGYPISSFYSENVSTAMSSFNDECPLDIPFMFWTDKTTNGTMVVEKPSTIRSLLGGNEGSILDIYGGEYEFDKFAVKLHNNRGINRGVTMRYGKNLTDLKQEENCSSVHTGVYPFWYSEEYGLKELSSDPERKIVYADGTYDFVRIYPLDLSQEFESKPTSKQLKEKAQQYIKNNKIGVPKISLTISFVQLTQSEEYKDLSMLEEVHLCDTVNVEFPELNVNATAKCISTTYNVLTQKYDKLELGDSKSNLETTISENTNAVKKTPTKSFMDKAIENATQLISGGLGGNVIIHSSSGGNKPDEILIMDTNDIKTATKVWRWNSGGLGYSNKGYNGPYETAITQDGSIVAGFITTGTLNGALIKAGTIDASAIKAGTIDASKIKAGTISTSFNNSSKYVQITSSAIKIYDGEISDDKALSTYNRNGLSFDNGSTEIGHIGVNNIKDHPETKGLIFDLDGGGQYMAWATKNKRSDTTYTMILYYTKGPGQLPNKGLHLGTSLYCEKNTVDSANLKNSKADGYSVADNKRIPIVTNIKKNSDGSITWTNSSITVRNGMITSVPGTSTSIT